jgi:hypothetical protein
MTGSVRRPLLFLDVDGPLIPFGSPQPYPTYETDRPETRETAAHPLLSRLDPAHGPRLAALPCEVVWATTWTSDANECIAPRLAVHHPGRALLHRVDARAGLGDGDYRLLEEWLRALQGPT